MTNESMPAQEITRLLSKLVDDSITEEEFEQLDSMMRDDPQARRIYMHFVDMHDELAELTIPHLPVAKLDKSFGEQAERPGDFRYSGKSPLASPRTRLAVGIRYAMIAATTLFITLAGQWGYRQVHDVDQPVPAPEVVAQANVPTEFVATLQRSVACQWRDAPAGMLEGSRLMPGELLLQQGTAEIRFDSGAALTVEGPAQLEIISQFVAQLSKGKAVFRGDSRGIFELRTPQASLLDIGTEYAVKVGPGGEEVHVFDGEVHRLGADQAKDQLLRGNAKRYSARQPQIGQSIELAEKEYAKLRRLEDKPPSNDVAAQLLAHEGFAYADPLALMSGIGNAGTGWQKPWRGVFLPPISAAAGRIPLVNTSHGLSRKEDREHSPGMLEYPAVAGAPQLSVYRNLSQSIDLDQDGIYYVSFRIQFKRLPENPELELPQRGTNAFLLALRDRTRNTELAHELRIGVHSLSRVLSVMMDGKSTQVAVPFQEEQTYLLVGKLVCNEELPDQVLLRVFGPDEPPAAQEPTSWTLMSHEANSSDTFDAITLHINSRNDRQRIDELRIGTSWAAVTASAALENP